MTTKDEELREKLLKLAADESVYDLDMIIDRIMTLIASYTREEGYDPNRLGSWIFIGDNARLKNLDDLYWSYVVEYVEKNSADYDHYELDYLIKNMGYAGFDKVGIHHLLADADQNARKRIQTLQAKPEGKPNE